MMRSFVSNFPSFRGPGVDNGEYLDKLDYE